MKALAASILLCAAAAAVVFAVQNWQRSRLRFPVSDEVSLQLVTTLHHGSPKYETWAWQRKLYNSLPDKLHSWMGRLLKSRWMLLEVEIGESALGFVFQPKFTTTPGAGSDSRKEYLEQAQSAVLSSSKGLRLRFGSAGYTGIVAFSALHNQGGQGNMYGNYFGSKIEPVPMTAKELTLEVVDEAASGKYETIQQVTIPNPIYRQMQPVGQPLALPAKVSHKNVHVTLEALISKTVSGITRDVDARGSSDYPDLQKMSFLRAPDGSIRPPCMAAVVRVNDRDSTQSQWGVSSLRFYYGDAGIVYPQSQHWNPLNQDLDRGRVQVFTFPNDVGVIGQPVKVVAELVRQRDFRPEELLTVDVELPTTGTYSHPALLGLDTPPAETVGGKLRERSAGISVANQAPIPFTQMVEDQQGYLSVLVDDVSEFEKIHKVELVRFDGSAVDLGRYRIDRKDEWLTLHKAYDLHNRRELPDTPAIDSADFERVRVTVVSPKRYEHLFEFIADPTEAQVPAKPQAHGR